MRILWLSPDLRPLARVYVESLRDLGIEVLLITADLHPESDRARDYERVLLGRPIPTADWVPVLKVFREAKAFKPDLVITEFLRDPRWRIFSDLAPRIRLIHDDAPHDATHVPPWWNRMFFNRWDERADFTITFSEYVAASLRQRSVRPSTNIYVAPLVSDLESRAIPEPVRAQDRRNIILLGRQRPYKNHKVIFEAWDAHIRSPSWPGDELVLIGEGAVDDPLPQHARWIKKAFRYKQMTGAIASARASLIHSRRASQSGVQVLSMQLGVPTLVSTAGALPEYQPASLPPIEVEDVEGLSRAMDRLGDVEEIERQSANAIQRYQSMYDAKIAAQRLRQIFQEILDR